MTKQYDSTFAFTPFRVATLPKAYISPADAGIRLAQFNPPTSGFRTKIVPIKPKTAVASRTRPMARRDQITLMNITKTGAVNSPAATATIGKNLNSQNKQTSHQIKTYCGPELAKVFWVQIPSKK